MGRLQDIKREIDKVDGMLEGNETKLDEEMKRTPKDWKKIAVLYKVRCGLLGRLVSLLED